MPDNMTIRWILILAACLPLACAQIKAQTPAPEKGPGAGSRLREWQNSSGKALKGWMQGIDGQNVSIKLESTGKPVKVPLASLADADRIFALETGWKLPRPWTKWPSDIKMGLGDVQVDLVSTAAGKHVYHTRHFEFVAGQPLGQVPAKDIARMFEASYELLQASPWGILAKPREGRFRAELYPSREEYIAAGGPQQSAGVYMSDKKIFMVPFQTLGLESTAAGWQRSKDYSTQTLVHELTHMMMDEALAGMPLWLAEGTAEYMERMPMKIGAFTPGAHLAAIQESHKKQPAFDLAKTFVMDHATWHRGGAAEAPAPPSSRFGPGTRRIPPQGGGHGGHGAAHQLYEAGLLLTYYFIHLDGNGDAARLQRFIAACVKNSERLDLYAVRAEQYNKEFEAFIKRPDVKPMGGDRYQYPAELKPPLPPPWPFDGKEEDLAIQDLELLLDGRSMDALMKEVHAALAKAGLPPIPPAPQAPKRR